MVPACTSWHARFAIEVEHPHADWLYLGDIVVGIFVLGLLDRK